MRAVSLIVLALLAVCCLHQSSGQGLRIGYYQPRSRYQRPVYADRRSRLGRVQPGRGFSNGLAGGFFRPRQQEPKSYLARPSYGRNQLWEEQQQQLILRQQQRRQQHEQREAQRYQPPAPDYDHPRHVEEPREVDRDYRSPPTEQHHVSTDDKQEKYTPPATENSCWLASTKISCDRNALYRTIDGSCNNLRHPTWGQSIRPLSRFLPPQYEEGTKGTKMRTSGVRYQPLPSTRKVSTTIHEQASDRDLSHKLTNMHMLWGQFIDHDMGHTPLTPKMKCCNKEVKDRPDDCIPVSIPEDDPVWSNGRRPDDKCMELRRSMAVDRDQCGYLQWRDQLNNVTSTIDGSDVYGSTLVRENKIRARRGGLMKTTDDSLPIERPESPEKHDCNIPKGPVHGDQDRRCFAAGDKRSNVWNGLTALHELFVKEHNRIASVFYRQIDRYYPHMTDEEVDEKAYQETRRIIGAQLQVINYGEYLVDVFGEAGMRKWRLNLGQHVPYNPSVDPTISNVFSTAAFRFGHSQIAFGNQPKTVYYRNSTEFITFTSSFNQPSKYREVDVGFFNTLRGTVVEPALDMNPHFSTEVRDNLFARSFNLSGLDLTAVNNQRGREHGLKPYNAWRQFCGLPRVTLDYMPDHTRELQYKFARLYDDADDIDLFSAAITERLMPGAQIGPTFSCLLGLQFQRLKEGDRFWFENQGTYPNSFTDHQIRQLSQTTLSGIICQNTDTITIPENSMRLDSRMRYCRDLPTLDLHNWLNLRGY